MKHASRRYNGAMKKILIFPHNGNGLEALDCLGNDFKLAGFVDDEAGKQGRHANGYEVFGREAFKKYPDALVLAVPGAPWSYKDREKIISGLGIAPGRFATVIHPRASVSALAQIGKNVLIMAGVVVTSNAIIGDHVCIMPNSVIHHDSEIGDWSILAAGVIVTSYTKIGKNCYLGAGARVRNRVEIGDRSLVGMAANVIQSVEPDTTVAGNPAKKIA